MTINEVLDLLALPEQQFVDRWSRGVNYGPPRTKIKALGRSVKGALLFVPGCSNWSGVGMRSYYSPNIQFWDFTSDKHHIDATRKVFESSRQKPLTQARITALMKEYL